MSDSVRSIIKYFCDRFLNIEYYPPKISNILDLSIDSLKDFGNDIVGILNEMNIITIRDISKLSDNTIDILIRKKKINANTLKNAIIGANLISNAWNKRSSYNKKAKNKVVIAGLDFAGKTSLINRLINDYSYQDMLNLEPTIGFNVEEYETQRLNLIIWDLGGQKDHINEYLEEPEKYFVQLDVLIFVIDSQDDIRYDMALKYLNDIIDTLEYLKEYPFLMILLNKADSDIINDPEFQIKMEYLNEKITELIERKKNRWYFDIIKTSLYNIYSKTPEIVKNIKDVFSFKKKDDSKEKNGNTFNEEIQEKLQKIMDINLKLMDKVASELVGVRNTLSRITYSNSLRTSIGIPFEGAAYEYAPEVGKIGKKRKKKSSKQGPPKRLKSLPIPKEAKNEKQKSEKIASEEILKVKESLVQTPVIKSPPGGPPPELNIKPPVPQNRGLFLQNQVISELKDVFAKRGVSN